MFQNFPRAPGFEILIAILSKCQTEMTGENYLLLSM